MSNSTVNDTQKVFCEMHSVEHTPTELSDKIGVATPTIHLLPINGLRHPPTSGTSGWYIWCGEELSVSPDFFKPVHAGHVYEDMPQIAHLLGLPPGFRFLLVGNYLDVWYDASLIEI